MHLINRDARCVYIGDNFAQAEVVALWLSEQGVPAKVMNGATMGGLDGLTWMSSSGVSPRGVEVWVSNDAQIAQAKELVTEHQAVLDLKALRTADAPETIEVVCEDCGRSTKFSGKESGSVQNCVHCGAYMDLFADTEDWGEGEAETEG